MNTYPTEKITNFAIAGAAGSGKTTLAEALLLKAGAISRQGRTQDANTVSDFDPEEIKRKASVNSSLLAFEHNGRKYNMFDTPGYMDFIGEVISVLSVSETVVLAMDAVAGPAAGFDNVLHEAQRLHLPMMCVITKLCRKQADFSAAVDALRKKAGDGAVPVFVPAGKEAGFNAVFCLLDGGAPPDSIKAEAAQWRETLITALSETDESLLNDYLEGKPVPRDKMAAALKKSVLECKVFPVLCCDAETGAGVAEILAFAEEFMPSADKSHYAAQPAPAALVFKTILEAHTGDQNYARMFSGQLKHGDAVYNRSSAKEEKIGQIFTLLGKTRIDMPELKAGDIAVLSKLKSTRTGDVLCSKAAQPDIVKLEYPDPLVSLSVKPKNKGEEEKMAAALESMMRESPTFRMHYDPETRETVVNAAGDIQLDVIFSRIKSRYGLEVETGEPRIPYKETIRGRARGQGKYKKQTGGRGQYGDVWLELEPLPRGSGFVFEEKIFGGAVPRNYIPAVEKGIREALTQGVVAGYPVVDLKVTLVDGSYHEVDSSDLAFKIAASMGFKKVFHDAHPVLLEPIVNLTVNAPQDCLGDVTGDLNKRRGRINSMEGGAITATVPLSELSKYSGALNSLTSGRGSYTFKFARYDEVSVPVQQKLVEFYTKLRESGNLRSKDE
ncbi:MAG: elongation factor G [Elusimicrobiales bacterium]